MKRGGNARESVQPQNFPTALTFRWFSRRGKEHDHADHYWDLPHKARYLRDKETQR
jgi:hypothetical protein